MKNKMELRTNHSRIPDRDREKKMLKRFVYGVIFGTIIFWTVIFTTQNSFLAMVNAVILTIILDQWGVFLFFWDFVYSRLC